MTCFQALSTIMSVDDLHENTIIKRKKERKLFEDQIKRIAEKEGLVKR